MRAAVATLALLGTASAFMSPGGARSSGMRMSSKNVLVIGGTRFSGLYLWKELLDQGHRVTLFNRGKTELKPLPTESPAEFEARKAATTFIAGDRKNVDDLNSKLSGLPFDAVFDMNARELEDTKPMADLFRGKVDNYVFMSSAGVYLKSDVMPHMEQDAVDPKCRHKGKLDSEDYLKSIGMPYTAIRPTYIYGPGNYNPIEEMFFSRLDQGRPICIPGHGKHFTGLGHVKDLAKAFVAVLGSEAAKGQVYNVQDVRAITFTGMAYACAEAMGMSPDDVKIQHYDPKAVDLGKAKAFPFRPQHFFTSPDKALRDLDWSIEYDLTAGLLDSYANDFLAKKAAGTLKLDFSADDIILAASSVP